MFMEQQGSPCVFYAGSAGNPNPQLMKRSVANWLQTERNCGYNVGLAINGTFFNDTSSNPTSSLSFPSWSASPGYVTGNNTSVTRYCFAFGGASSTPGRSLWDITSSTWAAVGTEFTTAMPNGCSTSTTYHRVVGEDPTIVNNYPFPYNGGIPRTYIGKTGSTVCVLVGGSFTNADAVATMTTFGCSNSVQLDGGKSTQMSYWTGSSISSPVTGCCLDGGNRPVPQSIIIWR
jgi:hypothetical protein